MTFWRRSRPDAPHTPTVAHAPVGDIVLVTDSVASGRGAVHTILQRLLLWIITKEVRRQDRVDDQVGLQVVQVRGRALALRVVAPPAPSLRAGPFLPLALALFLAFCSPSPVFSTPIGAASSPSFALFCAAMVVVLSRWSCRCCCCALPMTPGRWKLALLLRGLHPGRLAFKRPT